MCRFIIQAHDRRCLTTDQGVAMGKFKWLLRKAGFVNQQTKIDRKRAMKYLEVTERTLERWMSTDKACPRATKLLEQLAEGKLPHDKWEGFYICNEGYLWTPYGTRYEPEFISKIYIMQRAASFQQSQIMKQQNQIKNLKHLSENKEKIEKLVSEIKGVLEYTENEFIDFEMTLHDPQNPPKLALVK